MLVKERRMQKYIVSQSSIVIGNEKFSHQKGFDRKSSGRLVPALVKAFSFLWSWSVIMGALFQS